MELPKWLYYTLQVWILGTLFYAAYYHHWITIILLGIAYGIGRWMRYTQEKEDDDE